MANGKRGKCHQCVGGWEGGCGGVNKTACQSEFKIIIAHNAARSAY